MTKLKLILMGLLTGTQVSVIAQDQALRIGDTIPDLEITGILNYPSSSIRLSQLRGKAVILDFCNTSCSSCTENMPRLMALKKQFSGQLEVIRITRNTEKQLDVLYKRSEIAKKNKLPVAVADTLFSKFFPVKMPHHAWIDGEGVVRAITNARNTVPSNILTLIKRGEINTTPVAYLESFDTKKPLFADSRINLSEHAKQYSMITKYIDGIDARLGFSVDAKSGTFTRRAFYNLPLRLLFKLAHGGFDDNRFGIPSDNRKVILQVKDTTRFVPPADPAKVVPWEWKNYWCFESQVTEDNSGKLATIMQAELSSYFNLDATVEKRRVTGLALVKINNNKGLQSKGGYSRGSYNVQTHEFAIQNSAVKELISILESIFESSIIVDETGIDHKIDISIYKSNDVRIVRKALQAYGLDLVEKQVETEMLVIKDRM